MAYAPQRWTPAPTPGLAGRYAPTGSLAAPELHPLPGRGPEDPLPDGEGGVVTGLDDGRVVRLDVATGAVRQLAATGGRPLGLAWLPDGDLLVCDAERGLLQVPRAGGHASLLADATSAGAPLALVNNAAVEPDGTIWFSDSTRNHTLADLVPDLLEHNGTGRLLRRDADGTVEEVLGGLSFANGVELVGDDVWVAETAAYAIHAVARSGPGAGRSRLVADDLPGFPDNLAADADGTVWCPLPSTRNTLADLLAPRHPALRRLVVALPQALRPDATRVAVVLGLGPDGAVRHVLHGDGDPLHYVTGARSDGTHLWLGSVHEDVPHLARVALP